MSSIAFDEFVDDALQLPVELRTSLAALLIDSIDGARDTTVSPLWSTELKRRVSDIDRGQTEMIDRDEVWKRVNERFGTDF